MTTDSDAAVLPSTLAGNVTMTVSFCVIVLPLLAEQRCWGTLMVFSMVVSGVFMVIVDLLAKGQKCEPVSAIKRFLP